MSDIKIKTIGELIDQLFTTNMRCWVAQDKIFSAELSQAVQLEAAKEAQRQNAKRSQLIAAINDVLGQDGFTATKTYTYLDEKK